MSALGIDPEAETIAAAIIDLAHALDLIVIAEGVENDAQLATLRDLSCDQALGFYWSRPLDSGVLTEQMLTGR